RPRFDASSLRPRADADGAGAGVCSDRSGPGSTRGCFMSTAHLSTSDRLQEAVGNPISWGQDLRAMIACMGLGLLLAVLPHLVEWVRSGELVWVADFDDFSVYLPLASQAFHHNPFRLDDTVVPEAGRSYYS